MNDTLVQQGISAINRSLVEFSRRCDSFESTIRQAKGSCNIDYLKVRILNNQLNMLGKTFIDPRLKVSNPAVFRHVAYLDMFPGVNIESNNDTADIHEQLSIVYRAISSAANILKPIQIMSH